jgi:hypothetical protein
VSFEMSLSHNLLERYRYPITSALGEVGGFWAISYGLMSVIVAVLNYKDDENYLVSKLFRAPKP